MKMNIGISVSLGDFLIIDFGKPIVSRDSTGVAEDKSADGISNRGILLNSPVVNMKIVVNDLFIVKNRCVDISYFFSLLTVKNISLGNVIVAGLDKNRFNAVLNAFNRYLVVLYLLLKICRNLERKEINSIGIILLLTCVKRLGYSISDFVKVKAYDFAVTFYNIVHTSVSFI